jgi:hypothetical protein
MLILIIALLSFTDAHFICHSDKTDLCIGYSGLLENGTKLQLKSRFSLQKKNETEKITWNVSSTKKVKSLFLNGGYFIQPELKRKTVGKVEQKISSVGLVKRTRVSSISYNKTQCLTIMECEPGKFCSPYPKRSAQKIKKGAYLFFLPCQYNGSYPIYSQSFIPNPPCAPGCFNGCEESCDSIYCSLLQCKLTPTRQPTVKQNQPTAQPTNQDTPQPSIINQPTPQPSIINQPSNQPTLQPSNQDITNQPTTQPTNQDITNQPTPQPSNQPTSEQPTSKQETPQPSIGFPLTVNQQIGIGIGVSLCLLMFCIVLLCIIFKRDINQFIIDQKAERKARLQLNQTN